jgi:hypothetical protein
MEIRPASIAQLSQARGGYLVEIDPGLQDIANDLARIDPNLRLRYSEAGEYFCVFYEPEHGDGYLIFTAQELDQRIVKRMEEVYFRCNQPGYSFADDLEQAEAKNDREADHAWREKNGELMEKLAWALRHDSNRSQHRIFVPEGVKS